MDDGEPDFTMGDLLQQLAEEFGYHRDGGHEDGVYTSQELSDLLGISRYMVTKILKKKHGDGEIEIVSKVIFEFGGTKPHTVQAYKLKEKGEEDGED